MKSRVALLLLLALLLTACGASLPDPSAEGDTGCHPALPHPAGKETVALRVAEADRQYLLFVPDGYDGTRRHSLLLIFHGAGPSADGRPKSEFEFDEIWNVSPFEFPADMIVAAPQAAVDSWGSDPDGADAALAALVLEDVEERLCVDPDRIYATGVSSGGVLVSTLACGLSDRLAAVGTTIGMVDPFESCEGEPAPLPLVSIIGERDAIFRADKVAADHEAWARHNGCEDDSSDLYDGMQVTLNEFGGCTDDASVALYVVHDMRHQQARSDCSNIPSFVRGQVCFLSEFDFRDIQMDFFAKHSRAHR